MTQAPWKVNNHALSWAEHVEQKSMEQIIDLSKMPFIFEHVAVMPDVHFGLGASVGTVIPTLGAIIPAAVGVDIGCGMIAARTSLTEGDLPDDLSDIRGAIEHQVPLSAGRYNSRVRGTAKAHADLLEADAENSRRLVFYDKVDKRWRRQIGSLGSGNHFIELVLDERGRVWIFLHSGSRGNRKQDRAAPHRGRPGLRRAAPRIAAQPRPRLPRRGDPGVRRLHHRPPVGAEVRPAEP